MPCQPARQCQWRWKFWPKKIRHFRYERHRDTDRHLCRHRVDVSPPARGRPPALRSCVHQSTTLRGVPQPACTHTYIYQARVSISRMGPISTIRVLLGERAPARARISSGLPTSNLRNSRTGVTGIVATLFTVRSTRVSILRRFPPSASSPLSATLRVLAFAALTLATNVLAVSFEARTLCSLIVSSCYTLR